MNKEKENIIKKIGVCEDYLVICDHASNNMPLEYGNLGISKKDLESHRAFDLGASEVASELSNLLNCNLVMANFSRLLIDPNRGKDDPTLIPKLSEGKIIKGNANISMSEDDMERSKRIHLFYLPYHKQINRFINKSLDNGRIPKILSIHSFTPIWKGKKREIDVGILWDKDDRLSKIFLNSLKNIKLGDNKPYSGRLKNDTLYKHATSHGIPHVLIELRQDLLKKEKDKLQWAKKIHNVLKENEKNIKSFSLKKYGSYTFKGE
ncbi:MAG: N-formylglutamate amidohydrolase [Rhodobiaceae bacterium]|nr:N-formylglutamate amidohydrolase [Rhodobiaceae bacterium]